MQWVYTPYVLPLLITLITVGMLVIFLWERRSAPGATPLMVTMAGGMVWTLFYTLEFLSPDLSSKLFWNNVQYFGIVLVPLSMMLFAAEYTGRRAWIKPGVLAGLVAIPLLTILLAWTNPLHHWLYRDLWLASSGVFTYLDRSYGPWFWVWITYCYLMLGLGFAFLVLSLRGASKRWFRQTVLLILGCLISWLGNALSLYNINPLPFLDLSSITYGITGIIAVWSVFRYRLFDILPLARTAVIDRMPEGVVIFNEKGRVIDMNPAAAAILNLTPQRAVGLHFAEMFARFPELVEQVLKNVDTQVRTTTGDGEDQRFFSIILKSLYDPHKVFAGRLALIREVTEDKRAKQELEKSHAMLVATFEATADGIMVVNSRGKCIHYNQKFIEMWRVPGEVRTVDLEQDFTSFILDQLANPAAYYRIMNKLSLQPDVETYDIMELKDGRILERYSCPQRIQDRRVGRVWSFRDITEQRRAEEKLRYLSTHDILTGLYNRVYFEEEINRLENSRQYPISIIMADVDGLKETNDVYGHQAGDALLRKAAEVLRQACRSEDMVARIGGDEFGILLPYSNAAVADNALRRIQNSLTASRIEGGESAISLSVGAATADKGQSLRKVLRQADQAMYQVKSARSSRRQGGRRAEENLIHD